MLLRYSDLTQEQINSIANGCGGKGSLIPVPNFLFKASCNQHDFYYWRGGDESDREAADDAFYKYMCIDIEDNAKGLVEKLWYHAWALLYYLAVRQFGDKYFYYSTSMRTLKDIK